MGKVQKSSGSRNMSNAEHQANQRLRIRAFVSIRAFQYVSAVASLFVLATPALAQDGNDRAASTEAAASVQIPNKLALVLNLGADFASAEQLVAKLAEELGLDAQAIAYMQDTSGWNDAQLRIEMQDNVLVFEYRDPQGVERTRRVLANNPVALDLKLLTWMSANVIRDQSTALLSQTKPDPLIIPQKQALTQAKASKNQPSKPKPSARKLAKRSAKDKTNAANNRQADAEAYWYLAPHAGFSAWDDRVGVRIAADYGYRFGTFAIGSQIALSAGRIENVSYTVDQTITAPSTRMGFEAGSYLSFTIPLYLALRQDFGRAGVALGAGPSLRMSFLSVGDLSAIAWDPGVFGYLEFNYQVASGLRLALQPSLNYNFSGHRLVGFEETLTTAPTQIETITGEIQLIEASLTVGLQWEL